MILSLLKRHSLVSLVIASFMLTGCAVSLAADVTPPPGAQSFSAEDRPAPVSGSVFPIVPPDPENGREIYLEKCAPCHGTLGMGDGPQGLQLSVPVPPLGDPSLAQGVRPVEWYQIVTEGNLERFMPPFRSLDERQRWDVVAYAMTLSMRPEVLEEGRQVYESACQDCHGPGGEGIQTVPGWQADTSRLAQLSIMEMAAIITGGRGTMPAFGGQISQSQVLSAATYARSLSFSRAAPQQTTQEDPQALPTATAAPLTETNESGLVTISGQVSNASGGSLPENLTVKLTAYDGMSEVFTAETPLGADGKYVFTDIELAPSRTFITSISYEGMTYNSDVYHNLGTAPVGEIDLPIQIFGTTTDTSALRVDRMHVFFDFTNPEAVQVVELFIVNNTGSSVIVDDGSGRGVIAFDLPEGAQNLQFQDGVLGGRYLPTEKGFADTSSFAPGAGAQILFAYELPYARNLNVDIPIPLPVDAAIVMLPQGAMSVQSDQLQYMGQQDVQGVNIDLYTAGGLQAGSTLRLTLSGRSAAASGLQLGSPTGLIIGLLVFALALGGAGYWLFRQRKNARLPETEASVAVDQESADELMDAIIALDDRFKAGEIPEDAYLQRRAELKERLKEQVGG